MFARLFNVVVFVVAVAFATSANAAKRVALVIGNSNYEWQSKLPNPKQDAEQMTKTLSAIGYEVDTHFDLDENQMERALAGFAAKADEADVAMVFYSGHGMEIDGTNYVIPVDARLTRERDAKFEAVALEVVRSATEGAKKLKVVILDACRNNTFLPTTRSGGTRGLGRIVAEAGEVIAYSTAPGAVAQDGEPGGLSPYTRALSEKLAEDPEMDVRFLFTSLGRLTEQYAGVQQRPYTEFAAILPDGRLPLGQNPDRGESEAFASAFAAGDIDKLRELVKTFPSYERADEARAAIRAFDDAKIDERIDAALRSLDQEELLAVRTIAAGRPQAEEVAKQLALHERIDRATAVRDLDSLDAIYSDLKDLHPRRSEVRLALRVAVISDACSKLIGYGIGCPPELLKLSTPPPPKQEVAAVAQPAPETVERATEPEEPVDPLSGYLDDASPEALEKAKSVKVEWIQTALQSLGFYKGRIDGGMGPGTRGAIADWRAATGLESRGLLTGEEIVALMKQAADRAAPAEAYLGVMYGLGVGVDLDQVESRRRLNSASAAGFADARTYLNSISRTWK